MARAMGEQEVGAAMVLCRKLSPLKADLVQMMLKSKISWAGGMAAICVDDWQLQNTFQEVIHEQPLGLPKGFIESGHVHWVACAPSVEAARRMLLNNSVKVVGLDRETKPQFTAGAPQNICALLQIATRTDAFLFDLLALGTLADDLFRTLFEDASIIKIGQGWEGDMATLTAERGQAGSPYQTAQGVLELSEVFAAVVPQYGSKPSLKKLCCFATGHTLSKKQQMSDWERRPLNPAQVEYAALDAHVLITIYDILSAQLEALGQNCTELVSVLCQSISV